MAINIGYCVELISLDAVLLCFSGIIPRLSLIQHSLYVRVVEKTLPHHSQGGSTER